MAGKDSGLGATVLGLEGFGLLAATGEDGELLMLVETDATVVGCWGCGVRARSKGRRRVKVRDLPVGGRLTVLVWSKRVWRCREAGCSVGDPASNGYSGRMRGCYATPGQSSRPRLFPVLSRSGVHRAARLRRRASTSAKSW